MTSYYGYPYRLYVPPSHLDDLKVKMTITTRTTTMETELLTRGIVIFGATGDLCKKKLIPALYKLWQKDLLPDNYLIMVLLEENHPRKIGKNLLVIILMTFFII